MYGGASYGVPYGKEHERYIRKAMGKSLRAGYDVHKMDRSAVDAVEAAVNVPEVDVMCTLDAGRGSALNAGGEAEMCACVMNGTNQHSVRRPS